MRRRRCHVRRRANLLQQLDAVAIGKQDVENDDVRDASATGPRAPRRRWQQERLEARVAEASARSIRTVRLSSTIRTVLFIARCRLVSSAASGGQRRTDLGERQDLLGGAEQHRFARHPVDHRRRFVLSDREPAGPAHLEQPGGAVPAHAGQQSTRSRRAVLRGHRLEQHVDRRPARMALRIAGETQPSAAHDQMQIRRRHDHPSGAVPTRLSVARVGRRDAPVWPSSQSANAAPNGSLMCSTSRIGSGNGAAARAGSRRWRRVLRSTRRSRRPCRRRRDRRRRTTLAAARRAAGPACRAVPADG